MSVPAINPSPQDRTPPPPGEMLRRAAEREIDLAVAAISAHARDHSHAVHECRKAIKRLRALVALGGRITGCAPRSIDRLLRDAARRLAPSRDATSAAATLAKLLDAETELAALAGLERIAPLTSETGEPAEDVLGKLAAVRVGLPACFEPSERFTVAALAVGIGASYDRAAAGMRRFARKDRSHRAHEWRKRVQRLLNQLNGTSGFGPERLAAQHERLVELADLLGDHQDLAMLRARLKSHPTRPPKATRSALRAAATRYQRALRQRALVLGAELFDERAPALAHDRRVDPSGPRHGN